MVTHLSSILAVSVTMVTHLSVAVALHPIANECIFTVLFMTPHDVIVPLYMTPYVPSQTQDLSG